MNQRYHLIGIGGIGMGAIANLLLEKGQIVSGSDLSESYLTGVLREKGAVIFFGHDSKNVESSDIVVYSSAIKEDNCELKYARQVGKKVLRRAECLALLMKDYASVTVSGAHGKTTTSSLAASLLVDAGINPTTAIGGIVIGNSENSILSDGKFFVAELDESDGSFLFFNPDYSIITNIDKEHMDFYPDWQSILDAYRKFIRGTKKHGFLIVCGEDPNLTSICEGSGIEFKTYGFSEANDVYAKNIRLKNSVGDEDNISYTAFDCFYQGSFFSEFNLRLVGKFNVLNSLAVILLGIKLGIDVNVIKNTLKEFKGVKRRFQVRLRTRDFLVVDDYAHHPTEIKNTIEAANAVKDKRLVVLMQPHRYSRLHSLMDEFAESLVNCDYLIVTDIYSASETPIPGVSSETLTGKIKERSCKPVVFVEKNRLVDYVADIAQQGDLILFLGAGDISKLCGELADRLACKTVSVAT